MRDDAVIRPGYEYPAQQTVISAEMQAEKHRCCDIDTRLFGDRVDITFLGSAALRVIVASGVSILGQVHVSSAFQQSGPIRLGEPLTVRGRITAVDDVSRGILVRSVFDYHREDGSIAVSLERAGLRPGAANAERGPAATARRRPDQDATGFVPLLRKQLEPAKVAAYSDEFGNLIHSDPEVAQRYGFRAPIAAGMMAHNFMMEALARQGLPDRLRMEIRFLRPMYWDEPLDLLGRIVDDRLAEMRLVNGEGRPTSTCTVHTAGDPMAA